MATYTQEHDTALLQAPWLSKTDSSSKPYLLKYARHPAKPGFIVLVTDLTKICFEPLVGIRLLARQREVQEKYGESQRDKDAGASSLDTGGEEAVEDVLEGLDMLMGDELEEAELTVSPGDLYDLDAVVKSPSTNWVFHMTEIRYGCLEIITRHVIHPLALSLTSSKRPASTTNQQILELVSSNVVLSAINSHSAYPSKRSSGKDDEANEADSRPAKSRLVRRRDPDTAQAGPSTPSFAPDKASPSSDVKHSTSQRHSPHSKSPGDARAKKSAPKAPTSEAGEDEMMPDEDEAAPSIPSASERSPSPERPPRKGKEKQDRGEQPDEAMVEDRDEDSAKQSPEPDPLPPPTQKSQKERDDEEEAELAKKRDEMKRKMGAGGGGRLVRRRFGR